mmetsp:Transcript_27158/g.65249  ORF Transcript_27158/g.65249 Transcript_27158/m.65249 type:complete len:301 (-) Transcript_27158:967-1869(-)
MLLLLMRLLGLFLLLVLLRLLRWLLLLLLLIDGLIRQHPLVQVQQLQPRRRLEPPLVVPLAEVLELHPVRTLRLPVPHDVVRHRLRRVRDVPRNVVRAQAQALVAAREHDDEEGSEEEEEVAVRHGRPLLPIGPAGVVAPKEAEREHELVALLPPAQQREAAHELVQRDLLGFGEVEAEVEIAQRLLGGVGFAPRRALLDLPRSGEDAHHGVDERFGVDLHPRALLDGGFARGRRPREALGDVGEEDAPYILAGERQQAQFVDHRSNVVRVVAEHDQAAAVRQREREQHLRERRILGFGR